MLDLDESFMHIHTLFCRDIKICCDLRSFWKTWGEKVFFWGFHSLRERIWNHDNRLLRSGNKQQVDIWSKSTETLVINISNMRKLSALTDYFPILDILLAGVVVCISPDRFLGFFPHWATLSLLGRPCLISFSRSHNIIMEEKGKEPWVTITSIIIHILKSLTMKTFPKKDTYWFKRFFYCWWKLSTKPISFPDLMIIGSYIEHLINTELPMALKLSRVPIKKKERRCLVELLYPEGWRTPSNTSLQIWSSTPLMPKVLAKKRGGTPYPLIKCFGV